MRQRSGGWLSLEARGRRLRFTSSEESAVVSLSRSKMSPCLCSPAEFSCRGEAGTARETGMLIGAPIGNMFGMETPFIEVEEIFEDEELEIEKACIVVIELTKIDQTELLK